MGTVKVMTKTLGEKEVAEEQIITIREGLFGFPDCERFAVIEHSPESPFYWMQSLENKDLAFVVISPTEFLAEYDLRVSPAELESIGVKTPDDVVVLVIVTIPQDPKLMTANMQGPVVVNRHTRAGRQMISTDPKATTKHRIIPDGATEKEA